MSDEPDDDIALKQFIENYGTEAGLLKHATNQSIRIKELKEKLAVCAEALEFYAKMGKQKIKVCHECKSLNISWEENATTAREALERIGE